MPAQVTHLKEYSGEKVYVVPFWTDIKTNQKPAFKAFVNEATARDFFFNLNTGGTSSRAIRPKEVAKEDWESLTDRAGILEKWGPTLKEFAAKQAAEMKKIQFVEKATVDVKPELSSSGKGKPAGGEGGGKLTMDEKASKVSAAEAKVVGKWEKRYTQEGVTGEWHIIWEFKADKTAEQNTDFTDSPNGFLRHWRNVYKWSLTDSEVVLQMVSGDDADVEYKKNLRLKLDDGYLGNGYTKLK
jgi:hypothetical protein